jgi:hypothetical protein
MDDYKIVRKVFPGGNTTRGFYSFFDYIIKPDANRVFILKGGPGVGKSNFMKKIGNEMVDRGFSIEEHYCSSSNNSLDGLVIPKLKVALIDGTAPHMNDPKNPGAVDEIINLGDYWDVKNIQIKKEELMEVNKDVGRCFSRAYQYLKALNLIIKDITVIYEDKRNIYEFYRIQEELLNNIFRDFKQQKRSAYQRHLFGSAITPKGVIDYLETTVGVMENIYYIKGNWGTGWSELLFEVSKRAIALGFDVEIYHTPFEPELIEDVIIPELNLALTNNNKFKNKATMVIDLDELVDINILTNYQEELEFDEKMYQLLLNEAIQSVNKAKLVHDRLEGFYIPNMDFDKINAKRREVVKRILQYE